MRILSHIVKRTYCIAVFWVVCTLRLVRQFTFNISMSFAYLKSFWISAGYSMLERKHDEHLFAYFSQWNRNSGWMPSHLGVLLTFISLNAAVKSLKKNRVEKRVLCFHIGRLFESFQLFFYMNTMYSDAWSSRDTMCCDNIWRDRDLSNIIYSAAATMLSCWTSGMNFACWAASMLVSYLLINTFEKVLI